MQFSLTYIENEPFIQLEMFDSTKVFFGFVSQEGSKRQERIMNWWVSALRGHEYAFIVNKTSKQNKYYNSIDIDHNLYLSANESWNYYDDNRDRALKRITGLKYFLYNTTCDYYWSLTDDVALDLHGLKNVLIELEKMYNPNKDKVLMGQSHWKFIQGGTGFLISRKSAMIIDKRSVEWLRSVNIYDDVEADKWRKYLDLKVPQTYSPYVFGEEPVNFINESFYKYDYPECISRDYPFSPNYKLTNLIALHARGINANKVMINLINGKKFMHDLYFSYRRFRLYICKGSPY